MIGALIVGLFAGFLARALTPGPTPKGFLVTLLLGIAGAALGYLFFTELLGVGDPQAFDLGSLPGAVIGAMVLLLVYRRFAGPKTAGAR